MIGRFRRGMVAALLAAAVAPALLAQPIPPAAGPLDEATFRTRYVQLGTRESEGLLFEPAGDARNGIALIFSHPNGNNFGGPVGRQMARRGYRILMVNHRGDTATPDQYLPSLSRGIAYLRTLPGVRKVVLVGHSGGAHSATLYENVAENGPAACSGREKIYPCDTKRVAGLARTDGLVLLDPTLGATHQMSAVDPAWTPAQRLPAVDMFAPANGFDRAARTARYSPAFAARFHAAQAARYAQIVAQAQARMRLIEQGRGRFSDDEPFTVSATGADALGARLYQPDTRFIAHTKAPHLLLRADGRNVEQVIASVRPPLGKEAVDSLRSLEAMGTNTTVRSFLAKSAIRTLPGYAFTADEIKGVDWASAVNSSPGNAAGIRVPTLVLAMSCHYLVVPAEIIFNALPARDKSYAAVEGATHNFTACKPEYGDTAKRTFDFVDQWLIKEGRF